MVNFIGVGDRPKGSLKIKGLTLPQRDCSIPEFTGM